MAGDKLNNPIINYPPDPLRVLGPPGSGKTGLLIKRFFALREKGIETIIVTYSRGSFERMVDRVVSKGEAGFGSIPVLTYNRLAKKIIGSCNMSPPKLIEEIEEGILVENSVRRLFSRFNSNYKKVAHSERFREGMRELFHILQQNGVGVKHIEELLAKRKLSSRVRDSLMLYKEFITSINRRNLFAYYGMSHAALEALRKRPDKNPFLNTKVFLVDDFQDVDRGQFELLKALAPCGGGAVLNVFGDPTGARFGHRGTEQSILMEEFGELYNCETFHLPIEAGKIPGLAPVISVLLKETIGEDSRLYLSDGGNSGWEEKSKPRDYEEALGDRAEFVNFKASDEYEEIALVGSIIWRILDRGKYRPEEIAIIGRDKIQYEPLLATAARQYGFLLDTGDSGQDVFKTLTSSIFSLLLDANDHSSRGIILTSPLRENLEKVLSTHFQISRDSEQWDTISLLHSFSGEIAGLDAPTWFGKVMDCIVIHLVQVLEAVEKDPFPRIFSRELREKFKRYCDFTSMLGGKPDVNACLRLVFSRRFDEVGPKRGRVGFYSCNETSGRFFPVVFLLGCSETIFPKLGSVEGFIPWDKFGQVIGELRGIEDVKLSKVRSTEEKLRDEQSLLLYTIKRALDVLVITSPGRFGEEELSAPSGILEISVKGSQLDASSMLSYPPVIEVSKLISLGDSRELEERIGFTNASLWMQRQRDKESFSLKKIPLSPSSMQTYCTCPRKFFYSKILRIREKKSLGMQIGSLFHALSSRLFGQYPSRKLVVDAIGRGEHEEIIKSLMAQESFDPESLVGMISYRVLKKYAESLAGFEKEKEEDFQKALTEQDLSFESGGYSFTGKVDRIDFLSGGRIHIIDYKTASKVLTTGKGVRNRVVASKDNLEKQDWQVPLYTWAAKSQWKSLPECFSYYCLGFSKGPLVTSLLLLNSHEEWEKKSGQFNKRNSRISYLLEEELEEVIERAVFVAEGIFSERESFERTDKDNNCRICSFKEVCLGRKHEA